MSLAYFHHPDASGLAVGGTAVLEGPEGHHAAVVRRIAVGEQVVLTDGAGVVARVRVAEVGKGSLQAEVLDVASLPAESPRVVVVQAVPKGERGELAVEMLTEVGVDVIVPWTAARSVSRWRGERAEKGLAKWRSAAREAAKQSRRSWFPEVRPLAEEGGRSESENGQIVFRLRDSFRSR